MADAVPVLTVAAVFVILLLAAIRRSSMSREVKLFLAALAAVATGLAIAIYGVIAEANYVSCDPSFGRCKDHLEAQPILVDVGLGLVVLAPILAVLRNELASRRQSGHNDDRSSDIR